MKREPSKLIDLTGNIYGRLTVISYHGFRRRRSTWNCLCICGNKTIATGSSLKIGHTKSCGCLQRDATTFHGEAGGRKISKEYRAYMHIKDRCCNPATKNYYNYGGRGIKICDRWKSSFENFLEDMGRAPSPKHSIDRIDNNGNYEPDNCRWATQKEQLNNTRVNRRIEYNGEIKTLTEWAQQSKVKLSAIRSRINTGWSIGDALNKPSQSDRSKVKTNQCK